MKHALNRLALGFGRKLPLILQTESSECGLACIAMVAGFYGYYTDLSTLRRRFPMSQKGTTLGALIRVAKGMSLVTRPLKLDVERVGQLRLPSVIHWNFDHFVVLKDMKRGKVTIFDPAVGERRLSIAEFGKCFTGIALELWPDAGFEQKNEVRRVRLRELLGRVSGLGSSIAQVLLLATVLEVFTILSPVFQQIIVDDVIVSADWDLLTTLALGFGLLMIAQQVVSTIRSWVLMRISVNLDLQWKANVFTKLLQLPVAYFERRHLGDVVSRFDAVNIIQRTFAASFFEAALDGVMTVITLILMFVYSATLAWIAVGAMALYALGRWVRYHPARRAAEDYTVLNAKQQSHFLETIRGVKVIKLFQRQDERRSTWLSLLVNQVNADIRQQKLAVLFSSINGLTFGVGNVLTVWLGARYVLAGDFSVGLLIAFLAYKLQFENRVSSLVDKFIDIKMLQVQGERLADIVFTESENLYSTASEGRSIEACASLEVRNLKFRYGENESYVLDGVNLKIAEGECVAIAGPSGGGKTTLLNIMLGIHQPTEGEVLVGGMKIGEIGLETVRTMIGTVLQDDVLFAGSIADNISFFDHDADQTWVEECASIASVHMDIVSMPMGYHTQVGDMGTVLSGGQKQRVLLARALYKRPRILFLDEATSHLDIFREQEVNNAVKSLSITRVIVAHRSETISSADRIVVLDGGVVQDAGPRQFWPKQMSNPSTQLASDSLAST